MSKKVKKIVCLGGGNAMPKAVLTGLKKHPVKLSVICAMLDTGGSAGRLRKEFKIVSPGDIRRALVALANTSPVIENLFNYRFKTGKLKDHNFANLFIAALELTTANYEKTISEISRFLNIKHEVLPVTLDNANLYAVLENGKIISGEANIDMPKHNGNLKIKKVYLKPKAKIYPKAAIAIKEADLIIIGPGDLYSSLAQILLTEGISEAIKKSKAKKVYICNLMIKYGETNNFSVLDFTKEIEKYLGGELDYVIYNTKKPSAKRLKIYKKQHPELLNLVKFDQKSLDTQATAKAMRTSFSSLPSPRKRGSVGKKFIGLDLLPFSGPIDHDSKKLTKIILNLCQPR